MLVNMDVKSWTKISSFFYLFICVLAAKVTTRAKINGSLCYAIDWSG